MHSCAEVCRGWFEPCFRPGLLAVALALVLSACGGGGGTKSNPPAAPTANPGGFTPTVAVDAGLTSVNPPSVPAQAAAATLPQYSQHLQLTNAAGAIGAGLLGQGVTIGVLDTGVNRGNPALAGRVLANYVNVGASGNDLSVDDAVGHGTVVAEMAAGSAVGNWGGGVAQQASIVSSRFIGDTPPTDDGSGEGNEITAGQGYGDYFRQLDAQLANAGAKIINNSWGGLYWNDPALTTELATAWKDFVAGRGGIVVFAAGNAGDDAVLRLNPSDNAALPSLAHDSALEKGWLTVVALDPANPSQLTAYSQQCGIAMNYCLAAPGDVIFIDPKAKSTDSSYSLWQGGGTSFAAPQVSGAAAVVWSAFPYFDNDLVRQTILGAAKDLGDPGVDAVYGWGLLDVSKAAKGPSNFAWGNVSVSFSGTSTWRNAIVGAGGLTKAGSGTLILTETSSYTGDTRVQAGGLYLQGGNAASDLYVSNGATVWSGGASKAVYNHGAYLATASGKAAAASFTQYADGNLGVWLGNPFTVNGTATLAGQLSVLGVKGGYTTTAKETLLTAQAVNGTFASLKSAPNVFLDASLGYDAGSVYLNLNRIDVSKAVASLGLGSGIVTGSAARLESAMQAIDGQLASGGAGIGNGFIDGAGALQQLAGAAQAERALRSLSGELHAQADAATFDSIAANARTLSSRFAGLAGQPIGFGSWYRQVDVPGQSDGGQTRSEGWMMGSDTRLSSGVMGMAFGQTRTDSRFDGRDRGHDRQTEARMYAGVLAGKAYALAQVGAGRVERQVQRQLLLGDRYASTGSDYASRYASFGGEAGYRFGLAGAGLTPYVGADYVRLDRDGFAEAGADGFGLSTRGSRAELMQSMAGLRAERSWSLGAHRIAMRGFAEWRDTLAADGLSLHARYTGADAWAALPEAPLAGSGGVLLGLHLDADGGPNASWSLGLDQRPGVRGPLRSWTARFALGF